MVKSRSPLLHREELQNKMESEFMSTPNVSLPMNYYPELQTQNYRSLGVSDGTVANPFSVVDLDPSWLTQAIKQLNEVKQEVREACTLDIEIDPVPNTAYQDAFQLLKFLDYNFVPMPDIGWLMDGGVGFEWRSVDSKGIGTMSIYGDNLVIYGALLENGSKDKGTCKLTDFVKLAHFLPMLNSLCSQ